MSFNSVDILDVRVHCLSRDQLIAQTISWAAQKKQRGVFYVNAHCLNISAGDSEYNRILNHADLVYPDGISVVWATRWLGVSPTEKLTGRAWISEFCSQTAENGLKIYILAGRPGVAKKAKAKLELEHPTIKIVGARDGFFTELDENSVIDEIQQTQPNILFVGMGTPIQEKWVDLHREQLPVSVIWVVGALFDYVAGLEKPVPKWLDRLALEWLWRFLMNPLDKWRRVFIGIPEFIIRFWFKKLFT